jgi:hypothetical protein
MMNSVRGEGIADVLEKYSKKVERDVLKYFLAELKMQPFNERSSKDC